jgi:hypothetical protein
LDLSTDGRTWWNQYTPLQLRCGGYNDINIKLWILVNSSNDYCTCSLHSAHVSCIFFGSVLYKFSIFKSKRFMSAHKHWDHTTVKNFCITWGDTGGCTVVLKGGTILMITGEHVDNDFIPWVKNSTPLIKTFVVDNLSELLIGQH